MTDTASPLKTALDAETDEALAYFRDARAKLHGHTPAGAFLRGMADGLAQQLAAQFPGVPSGRVLMAAAQGLKAVQEAAAEAGIHVSADMLLTIAALTAEQLDREES